MEWSGGSAVAGSQTIDQPLWKLLELDGRYYSEFISEGVLSIERINGERVTPSSGLIAKQIRVEELVDHHLLGCVVPGSEHRRLGAEVMALDDPWHNYRNANPPVRVWSRKSCRWVSD